MTMFEHYCEKCGRGPEYFLTKHHQGAFGEPTKRLCRECHNLVEGSMPRELLRDIVIHLSKCDVCYCLYEAIRSHADRPQLPIHRQNVSRKSPEGRRIEKLFLSPSAIPRETEKLPLDLR